MVPLEVFPGRGEQGRYVVSAQKHDSTVFKVHPWIVDGQNKEGMSNYALGNPIRHFPQHGIKAARV